MVKALLVIVAVMVASSYVQNGIVVRSEIPMPSAPEFIAVLCATSACATVANNCAKLKTSGGAALEVNVGEAKSSCLEEIEGSLKIGGQGSLSVNSDNLQVSGSILIESSGNIYIKRQLSSSLNVTIKDNSFVYGDLLGLRTGGVNIESGSKLQVGSVRTNFPCLYQSLVSNGDSVTFSSEASDCGVAEEISSKLSNVVVRVKSLGSQVKNLITNTIVGVLRTTLSAAADISVTVSASSYFDDIKADEGINIQANLTTETSKIDIDIAAGVTSKANITIAASLANKVKGGDNVAQLVVKGGMSCINPGNEKFSCDINLKNFQVIAIGQGVNTAGDIIISYNSACVNTKEPIEVGVKLLKATGAIRFRTSCPMTVSVAESAEGATITKQGDVTFFVAGVEQDLPTELSPGAIAGIVIGCGAALGLAGFGYIRLKRKHGVKS